MSDNSDVHGLFDFDQPWYRVRSRDGRSTTNVQGQVVKSQGYSVT